MRAAIYARQSIDKKDSISIETQIEMCKAMTDDALVYSDKGYSGSNVNRPSFQRLINDIKSGRVTKVYVYKLDRISRSLSDFMRMMEIFGEYGCEFASRSESFDTSTPFGRAMLQICMVFAELERENTIQRVRDAYKARSREGFYMGGRVPYRFSLVKTTLNGKSTSKYVPVPEEAEQVRLIFELYSHEDMTLSAAVRYLLSHDIVNLRGSVWQASRLSNMLHNPCYVMSDARVYRFFSGRGVCIDNDIEEFDGIRGAFLFGRRKHGKKFTNLENQHLMLALHEGLVEADIWLECQSKLERNKQITRHGQSSWLSGRIRCGKCGYSMKVTKSGERRYFSCTGKTALHICEGSGTIYAAEVEDIISEQIGIKLEETEFKSSAKPFNAREVNDLIIRLSKTEKEIDALLEKIAESDKTLFEYINKRITELDAKKQSLKAEIAAKQINTENAVTIDAGKIWSEADFNTKRTIAGLLIEKINIRENRLDIYWNI
ncbi:MAG: recombinase family protein [Oscillospiraceae bacterium]|nr:recombinase family protein [Oscillospiraceae bacterium]